jgi:tRNA threonylcarbamoyladenosine biosynthesis protein TsaB
VKILALEFSSPVRSVAALRDGLVGGQASESGPGERKALTLVCDALREASVRSDEIECLAIGVGPGSYTGIRMAIALAQGWQLARGVKLLAMSSVECLAARAQAEKLLGHVNIVIDAQRNEFYLAGYEVTPGVREEIEPLHLASMEEVKSHLAAREIVVGPEVSRWFREGRVLFPEAAMLGQLASGRSDFIEGEKLEPVYLRETSFVKAPLPRIIP